MFKGIKKLKLSSLILLIISCTTSNELSNKEHLDYTFIKGMEIPKGEGYQYSENCFLYYSEYKFLSEESYKYNKGLLKQYIYCGPEGADIRDYSKEKYSKDKLIYSKQKLFENKNEIIFNKIKYEIKSKIKDTIIGKYKDETILIIINTEPSK